MGDSAPADAAAGHPWSKAVLASNLKLLDRQKRELEDLLQVKLDAIVKAKDERAAHNTQYNGVTSQLRDMVEEKNRRERAITEARQQLLGILENYEAAVAAASKVLTCLKGGCQDLGQEMS